MKYLPLLLFWLGLTHLNAQERHSVYFQIVPPDAYLKLNDQVYHLVEEATPFQLELPAGAYPIAIWAPRFALFQDTLVVKPEGNTYYRQGLIQQSEAFLDYTERFKTFRQQQWLNAAMHTVLIGGHATALWIVLDGGSVSRVQSLKADLDRYRAIYDGAVALETIQQISADYEFTREEYDQERKQLYLKRAIGIPLVAATGYLSYRYLRKIRSQKLSRPEYEEQNPLVIRDAFFQLQPHQGLTMNIIFQF